jgi:hypothetical protein
MWGGMRSRLSARMSLRRQPEWQRRHIPAATCSSPRFFSDEPARRSQRAYDLAQEMFAEGRISAELLESVAIATADGRSDDGPLAGPDTAVTSIACSGAEADLDLGSGDLWYRPSVPSRSEKPTLPNALRAAAEGGHVTATERALIAGQDPNHASDSVGTTPLLLAVRNGHATVVDTLLAAGADVNQVGAWNFSPLMYAAIFDETAIARTLLECGADVSLRDVRGETALEHALGERNLETAAVIARYHPLPAAGPLKRVAVGFVGMWIGSVETVMSNSVALPPAAVLHVSFGKGGGQQRPLLMGALRRDVAAALRCQLARAAATRTQDQS